MSGQYYHDIVREHAPDNITIDFYEVPSELVTIALDIAKRDASYDPVLQLLPWLSKVTLSGQSIVANTTNATALFSAVSQWLSQQHQHEQLGSGSLPKAAVGSHAVLDGRLAKVAQGIPALPSPVLLSQGCSKKMEHIIFTCDENRSNSLWNQRNNSSSSSSSSRSRPLEGAPGTVKLAMTCEGTFYVLAEHSATYAMLVLCDAVFSTQVKLSASYELSQWPLCLLCTADGQVEVLYKLAPHLMSQVVIADAAVGNSDDNPVRQWTLQQKVCGALGTSLLKGVITALIHQTHCIWGQNWPTQLHQFLQLLLTLWATVIALYIVTPSILVPPPPATVMLQRVMARTVVSNLADASVEVVLVMSKAIFCALLCALAACATDTIHMCTVSSAMPKSRGDCSNLAILMVQCWQCRWQLCMRSYASTAGTYSWQVQVVGSKSRALKQC